MINTTNPVYKEWLAKDEDDFQFAKVNLAEEREFFDQICFHFQQAAEKYLKAYIVAYNLKFRKIHELPTLLEICQKHAAEFDELTDACDYLTEFYIETRYPTLWGGGITADQAQKALEYTDKIGELIKNKLSIKLS